MFRRGILGTAGATKHLILRIRKGWRLAILGAIGGLGGAGLGEAVLHLTRPPAFAAIEGPRSVCLLMDCSGSMQGGKLEEVKRAAEAFVLEQSKDPTEFAVVDFSRQAHVRASLTRDIDSVVSALRSMHADGSTAMHTGLDAAREVLKDASGTRQILLFTDGMPDSAPMATLAAQQARQGGVHIFAIATEDANHLILRALTGDQRRVVSAHSGHFVEAFAVAGRLIRDASLLETGGGFVSIKEALRCGGWSACLGHCLALALLLVQLSCPGFTATKSACVMRVLCCTALSFLVGAAVQLLFIVTRSDIVAMSIDSVLLGSLLAAVLGHLWIWDPTPRRIGALALFGGIYGLIVMVGGYWLSVRFGLHYLLVGLFRLVAWTLLGEWLAWLAYKIRTFRAYDQMEAHGLIACAVTYVVLVFAEAYFGEAPFITETTTRLLSWTVLGAAFGLTMAAFVPNLNWQLSGLAGAVGGLLGGVSFLIVTAYVEGMAARFIGAVLLGLWIGMMLEITVAVQDQIREVLRRLVERRRARKESIVQASSVGIPNQSWNDQLRDQRTRITSQIRDRLMQ